MDECRYNGDCDYRVTDEMKAELGISSASPAGSTAFAERGPWTARLVFPHGVFVESDDFTHDARLQVTGDFEDEDQMLNYATELARRLSVACR